MGWDGQQWRTRYKRIQPKESLMQMLTEETISSYIYAKRKMVKWLTLMLETMNDPNTVKGVMLHVKWQRYKPTRGEQTAKMASDTNSIPAHSY